MKKIIVLLVCAVCMSCSFKSEERMTTDILACEHTLDSLADNSSFMDVTAETDEYIDLCDAYADFENANTRVGMATAYANYMRLYEKVIALHNQNEGAAN